MAQHDLLNGFIYVMSFYSHLLTCVVTKEESVYSVKWTEHEWRYILYKPSRVLVSVVYFVCVMFVFELKKMNLNLNLKVAVRDDAVWIRRYVATTKSCIKRFPQ